MVSVVVLPLMAVVVKWMSVVAMLRMKKRVVVVMRTMSVAVRFDDLDRFELTAPKDPGGWGSEKVR